MAIKVETKKDMDLLKFLARTGIITDEVLKKIGVYNKRKIQHIKSRNIIKQVHMIYGRFRNVYFLTEETKKKIKNNFGINSYRTKRTQLEHDYVLMKLYLRLNNKEKDSWLTEHDLQLRYNSEVTVDGLFFSSGKKIGVEVITPSYSKEDIRLKNMFIQRHCDDCIVIHTHSEIDL